MSRDRSKCSRCDDRPTAVEHACPIGDRCTCCEFCTAVCEAAKHNPMPSILEKHRKLVRVLAHFFGVPEPSAIDDSGAPK